MQTAALLLAAGKQVTALLTIDPLSPIECDFKSFKGCQRAPQDISQETLERVSREVGSWINYVSDVNTEGQKFFLRFKKGLHSSPIEQAHRNFLVDLNHREIVYFDPIWAHLTALLQRVRQP